MTKQRNIGYWASTALLAADFAFAGTAAALGAPFMIELLDHLGYPTYFGTLLGVWKVLGAIAVIVPGRARLKEWAYAGMLFDLSSAVISHLVAGDGAQGAAPPFVILCIAFASWRLRPASRRLGSSADGRDDAESVVRFWQDAGPPRWFAKDGEFDARFRQRFLRLHEAAARGELADWGRSPESALALVLLLDQFPRNAFRGTPRMYATDALARATADSALRAGHASKVPHELRVFFFLPFGHSEELRDQERSVALARELDPKNATRAEHHRDIVMRFGRFPHRNAILGRTARPEEQQYLAEGGYAG